MSTQNTKKVLQLLADGKERSIKQICDALDITAKQVESSLQGCRITGAVVSIPTTYKITEAGRQRAAHVPLTQQQKIAKARDLRREQREARQLERAALAARIELRRQEVMALKAETKLTHVAATAATQSLVRSAMKSRPALDMAWMSVAREQEASHA